MCATLSALAACAACLLYGKHVKAQAEQVRIDALERYGGEVVNLLVATRTLEYGDIIDSSSVASREWIADLAPDQALVRMEEVIGRQVTVPLAKGLPLTQLNLRDGTSGLALAQYRGGNARHRLCGLLEQHGPSCRRCACLGIAGGDHGLLVDSDDLARSASLRCERASCGRCSRRSSPRGSR